jgi:hypothetical protein
MIKGMTPDDLVFPPTEEEDDIVKRQFMAKAGIYASNQTS